MDIKFTESQGVMAALVDVENKITEAIDIDRVNIRRLHIDYDAGVFQLKLALGGVDSKGKFHLSPEHAEKVAEFSIAKSRPQDKLFWDKYIANEDCVCGFLCNEEVLTNILKDPILEYGRFSLLEICCTNVWILPQAEMKIDDVTVFKKEFVPASIP